jgi:hypothetical protein
MLKNYWILGETVGGDMNRKKTKRKRKRKRKWMKK